MIQILFDKDILQMIQYRYHGRHYYRYDELKETNHPCLKGTRRGILAFCKKSKMVEGKDFLYARIKENKGWRRTASENYVRQMDKIFLSRKWVRSFETKPRAPKILHLDDNELFRDANGNAYDVEVRGERHHKKCFFKASDIAKCFDLPRLIDSLTHQNSAYVHGEDYERFIIDFPVTYGKVNEVIYLTYLGLVRAMIVSRTGRSKNFLDWAMDTLFTVQLGTTKQKNKLVTNLTGADYSTVKAFCNIINTKISVVYLFKLGMVKNLRDQLNIPDFYPDHAIVCKYGRTNDIKRRFSEHLRNKYSQKYGYQTTLLSAWFIDNQRGVGAENILKSYLQDNDFRLENTDHTEIAIFNIKEHLISPLLNPLFSEYANEIKILETIVRKLETRLETIENDHQNHLKALSEDHENRIESLAQEHRHQINLMDKNHQIDIQSIKNEYQLNLSASSNDIQLLKQDVRHLREMLNQKDIVIQMLKQ